MTGQDLLDRIELINQELQLQTGEADVTRGLLALNVAQDYFETLASAKGKIFGSAIGTVTTTANTESTAFPSGVLRIDRLQLLDANSRPEYDLEPISRVGGHGVNLIWPSNLFSTSSTGKPRAYWTNGSNIYWSPLPSGTHTVRYYGLASAANITASGTFAYPDIVAMPLATFAGRLLKTGVDDPAEDFSGLATQLFQPLMDSLFLFNRDKAEGLEYTRSHDS